MIKKRYNKMNRLGGNNLEIEIYPIYQKSQY